MEKVTLSPVVAMSPVPAVMVSCGDSPDNYNIMTASWAGVANSNPPMLYVSIQPPRHSFGIIQRTGEYVINLVPPQLGYALDKCGTVSGRDVDKWSLLGLTATPGAKVKAPLIAQCPMNIECRVVKTVELGSHFMFIGQVEAVNVDKDLLKDNVRPDYEKMDILMSHAGFYVKPGERVFKAWSTLEKKQ